MRRMMLSTMLAGAFMATAPVAWGETVTFDGFQHGEVIATSSDPNDPDVVDVGIAGLTFSVSVVNHKRNPDLAVIFDSTAAAGSDPDDPDLEGPPWAVGNLAPGTELGNLLIIQEAANSNTQIGDVVDADDEARRPAGYFDFFFSKPIDSFGFDLIDVEGSAEHDDAFFVTMFDDVGGAITEHTIAFADLTDPTKPVHQSDIEWGNNSANRVDSKLIEQWTNTGNISSLSETTRIRIGLGGSGAIDNLTFTFAEAPPPSTSAVPSPSALLAGLGGMGLLIARRRPRGATADRLWLR